MLNKISDSIYYLSNQDDRERPVLGLVCGEEASLIIDCGNSPQHAKEFLAEISKLDVPPVKYAVITHAHWDHFMGMNEFDAMAVVNTETDGLLQKWQSLSYGDSSLQTYVNSGFMNAKCMEVLQEDMPNRETFKLKPSDIIFEKTLVIDLGNKKCVLEKIRSTHTDDSTIVYIPDDKVIFLGDAAYGTTTNTLFHIKQPLLLPMIQDIQKYDAEWSVLGHESICDREEMELYWKELIAASAAAESASVEAGEENFKVQNNREPNGNELFFIKAFANDHVIRHQQ
ncbi:MBL fold metallo-hydrolase [Planococcus beigongshangi]|uniref:MBL fold metallo-hydrolase n=1 Tax=Planococcus beigongshangi TaxID=2782536 RepID=UPI00193B8F47|nr:MBL fold metallo-hydrolase [Planococcus beigongshangi]